MLKNAYLDAKIGVDPAENEPRKGQKDRAPRWRWPGARSPMVALRRLELRVLAHDLMDGLAPMLQLSIFGGGGGGDFCQILQNFDKIQQNFHNFLHPR